jgi:hypothetical protein
MNSNSDLLIVLEANKRAYSFWCLLIMLCKLDIKVARDLPVPGVEEYVYRQCGSILRKHAGYES